MERVVARTAQALLDMVVLSMAYWASYALRFEGQVPFQMFKHLVFTWPYVVGFQYMVLTGFGVTRFAWRYVGLREATRILTAEAVAGGVLGVVRIASVAVLPVFPYAQYTVVPFGIILMDIAFGFLGVTGVRVLRRMLSEWQETRGRRDDSVSAVPTVLIGAGKAGVLVAKEIMARPDLGILPVAFIDDDSMKVGTVVHGVPVVGTTAQLVEVYKRYRAHQVLITIAAASGKDIRRITRLCNQAEIPTKIIPGVYEIVGGNVNLSRIRKVAIEDLLGRDPVVFDEVAVAGEVRGRTVMVTGAGGSIGSELCRQLCRCAPANLVLVERAENNLFQIHRELKEAHPELRITPFLADIAERPRMQVAFEGHRPAVVFHAAAHKHVPMLEWNPSEAIRNNVLGTRLLADLSHEYGVGEFVMVSTDKAVSPSSVMGASKRLAEIYVQAISQRSQTRFVAVRFGNVLGSAGSVIPIFQEQIAAGGPVTVTHPDMKRYFMTIPEACQLVLQAATMGKGGEIFILDMGEPVAIVDLARDLIVLSGYRPGEDIAIQFTGVRPGEKLFEELATAEEGAEKTWHPKIYVGKIPSRPPEEVDRMLESLKAISHSEDAAFVRKQLAEVLGEYKPQLAASDNGKSSEGHTPPEDEAPQGSMPRLVAT